MIKKIIATLTAAFLSLTIVATIIPTTLFATEEPTVVPVEINATNFPNDYFRGKVSTLFDKDNNGTLSVEEITNATELNISSDKNLTDVRGIEHLVYLDDLSLIDTKISNIDVSNNKALVGLYLFETNLSSIDVSNNKALEWLSLADTNISSIDVSNNTKLEILDLHNTSISSIDVSKNTALEGLDLSGSKISSIDVSKNTALIELFFSGTPISTIDLSNNTSLYRLYCNGCNLTKLVPPASAEDFDIGGQTSSAYLKTDKDGNKYVDMGDLMDASDFDKVSIDTASIDDCTFDSTTGIVKFNKSVPSFKYNFDVNGTSMDVTVTLTADYTEVDKAIAEAKALNRDDYISFDEVDKAIADVVRDKSFVEQDIVDGYAEAIRDAIANLKPKPTPAPPTSANANVTLVFVLGLILVAGGTLIYKKRKIR